MMMRTISRALMGAAAGLALMAAPALAQPVELTIHVDQPGPQINRNIYGQFAEHLGGGIYPGVWVGEESDIPNTRGIRNDVVAALRRLHVPVVRWPGGCFADIYHWRDGIGPRDQRPVRLNKLWGGVEESNAFGTHEFFDFAEQIGADVYLNANIGSGTVQEMADWVEYITSSSNSTLAQERRANGRDAPWRLPYFTIGNETWGCGGNMRAAFYADLYAQWATFINAPADNRPLRVASGGHQDLYEYTDVLMGHPTAAPLMDAISLHYYTRPTGGWDVKGPGIGFGEAEWIATLQQTMVMDDFINNHVAIMDRHDPEKRVGLYVDEWGTWYDPAPGSNPAFLVQNNTMRDAVVAALNFNIFHDHADRVRMTNIAQMVNVLQAAILTDGARMVLTPTYHAFHLYRPFQGARFVPATVQGAPAYRQGGQSVPKVSATAARGTDGKLYVGLINTHPRDAEVVRVDGAQPITRGSGRMLTGASTDAHNTFAQPNSVKPTPVELSGANGKLEVPLPPRSIVVLRLE